MAVDLRPLQRALGALRYTTPLREGDPSYIPRPDGLGEQILNRVMVPGMHRLLLGGPAGSGKSTELLQIYRLAHPRYTVVVCPCDRELDLYKLDVETLVRYLVWRILFVANNTDLSQKLSLTPEITRDALECVGTQTVVLQNARMFFAGPGSKAPEVSPTRLFDTFSRLVSEIEKSHLPVLLLIDGLEKVPPHRRESTLGEFVRSPVLDGCQAVIVVPLWTLYGKDSMEFYPDVEVLRVSVEEDTSFVRAIIAKRAGTVFEEDALESVALFSGGLPRDGLQIAWQACRIAMDERTSEKVHKSHVWRALEAIEQSFEAVLSDNPERAKTFLAVVRDTGRLSGDPEVRDLLLGHGIILPEAGGRFRVHPAIESFLGGQPPAGSATPQNT